MAAFEGHGVARRTWRRREPTIALSEWHRATMVVVGRGGARRATLWRSALDPWCGAMTAEGRGHGSSERKWRGKATGSIR